jgi:hypothetical protein
MNGKHCPTTLVRAMVKLGDPRVIDVLREALHQTAAAKDERYFHEQTRDALKLLGGLIETPDARVKHLSRF